MISDAELLKLVMDRYPEQPAQFLIEQFTVMKAGLIQANNKLAGMDSEALRAVTPDDGGNEGRGTDDGSAPEKSAGAGVKLTTTRSRAGCTAGCVSRKISNS